MTLVVAPLLIAESVWHTEAKLGRTPPVFSVERILGAPHQRVAAFNRPADIHVVNYDNLRWLSEVARHDLRFALLIAGEGRVQGHGGCAEAYTA